MSISKWRKVKQALGIKFGAPSMSSDPISDAVVLSPLIPQVSFSSRLFRTRSSSKKTCSICLATIELGDGQAIFTAECSHSFHFHCIALNVKHGNHFCPICRAKWKEVPFEGPTLDPSPHGRQRLISPLDNGFMTVIRRPPVSPRPNPNRHIIPSSSQPPEPTVFNDDECLDHQTETTASSDLHKATNNKISRNVNVETYPEVPAVPRLTLCDNFTILIHLKAPISLSPEENTILPGQSTRAPIDLVTVLDISGSMAGTKLALLKRAMGFVIQNLSPSDRLSVVAFSSTACRLFPLRRMSEKGKQQSLQAVNSLIANGGTNIAEGLRKGAKVMEDRRENNPVGSIILLSDGQDTYTVMSSNGSPTEPNYHLLLPQPVSSSKIPVHAFGFGTDHDASAMHAISDISGGTFSFIETESVIQDAFAQCIGGLLSVVVKDLQVHLESQSLNSLRSGRYPNRIASDRRTGSIEVGDLYAEEERDFLVSVTVPAEIDPTSETTSLLKVRCVYTDPLTKQTVTIERDEVRIERPEVVQEEMMLSVEVDRQRNRLKAAEAMARAKTAAEQGDLHGAANILESCRKELAKSISALSNDKLCLSLDAEMREMQERMASRHMYEASGRAYILSGLSSHSWQRATARGDSSHVQSYQTPSMVEMLSRSQASTLLASPSTTQRHLSSPKPR